MNFLACIEMFSRVGYLFKWVCCWACNFFLYFQGLNVYSILLHDTLVMSRDAVNRIVERMHTPINRWSDVLQFVLYSNDFESKDDKKSRITFFFLISSKYAKMQLDTRFLLLVCPSSFNWEHLLVELRWKIKRAMVILRWYFQTEIYSPWFSVLVLDTCWIWIPVSYFHLLQPLIVRRNFWILCAGSFGKE